VKTRELGPKFRARERGLSSKQGGGVRNYRWKAKRARVKPKEAKEEYFSHATGEKNLTDGPLHK